MSRAKEEYQRRAEEAVSESAESPNFSYSGDLPIGESWALTISKNRDSGILESANFDKISEDMDGRFRPGVAIERFNDPMVGWVEGLAVHMLDENGKVTRAGVAILQWADELAKYPVADDSQYSQRELEATIENIQSEAGLNEGDARAVHDWLFRHNPSAVENTDDRGGAPSMEQIENALRALGMLEEDEDDSPKPKKVAMVYADPPEQLRLWPGYQPPARDTGLSRPIR